MTNENILDAIGGINEKAVQDAKAYKSPKFKRWFRWGDMAACICLLVGIAIPILHHDHQDPLQAIVAFEFNGKFYEAVETPEVLEKYGLPAKITEDVAGNHVSYWKSDGGAGYECTPIETDIELYQYNLTAFMVACWDSIPSSFFVSFSTARSSSALIPPRPVERILSSSFSISAYSP